MFFVSNKRYYLRAGLPYPPGAGCAEELQKPLYRMESNGLEPIYIHANRGDNIFSLRYKRFFS